MNIQRTLKIIITPQFQLQIVLIDSSNNQTIIQLKDKQKQCIPFFINQNQQIQCIQDLFENPTEYKTYEIICQQKSYHVITEVLFALVLNEIKHSIEKEYILVDTQIELPIQNENVLNRLKTGLIAIDLKGVELETENDFDYSQQEEYLIDILQREEEIQTYQRLIENMSEEKQNEYKINKELIDSEETFTKSINKIPFQERSEMKLSYIDNYCLFIASRYLNSIDDHINLIHVCKRLRNNMEKFYYNPVSLNSITVKFFPNIETFHCYETNDKYLKGGRIIKYVDWRSMGYYQSINNNKNIDFKNTDFKNLAFTYNDQREWRQMNKHLRKNELDDDDVSVPEPVKEISEKAFNTFGIRSIHLPQSITSIHPKSIYRCYNLTNLTIPLDETRVLFGNKIFNNQPHFNQSIFLPSTLSVINGKQVEQLTSFTIPSYVTSIDEECFYGCYFVKEISIPSTIHSIPRKCFLQCFGLEKLTVSSEFIIEGNRLFKEENGCLYSIHLPSNIKFINDKTVDPLKSFTIPSNVTKLSDYCFANCEELTEIKGLENVKEFGIGCFMNCPMLSKEEYSQVKESMEQYLSTCLNKNQITTLEEWTSLHYNDILFDSNVDDWSQDTAMLTERIIGKKQLVFLIQDYHDDKFGEYINCEIANETLRPKNSDDKAFQFNLESHGRFQGPIKAEIIDTTRGYQLFAKQQNYSHLICFGTITLIKENFGPCQYFDGNAIFDYHGNKNILSKDFSFWLKRLVVIEMK